MSDRMMGLQHYDVAIFWRSPKCATERVIVGTAGEVNRLRAKSKTEVRISSSRVGRPQGGTAKHRDICSRTGNMVSIPHEGHRPKHARRLLEHSPRDEGSVGTLVQARQGRTLDIDG